jgi:hypothetical protein
MKNNSNKSVQYLELAKEVRLAHVPNKGKEAESLLNSTKSGTAQNIFTRIFNYFGRHLIMTFTSLIALIVAGLLITNTEQLKEQPVEAKPIASTKPVERKIDKEDLVYNEKNALNSNEEEIQEEKSDFQAKAIDTIVTVTLNKPEEIEWKYVELKVDRWYFLYLTAVETKQIIYEDTTNNHFSINHIHSVLDEEYYINVVKQLEEGLEGNIDFSEVKKLAFEDIDDYFAKLSVMCENIEKKENGVELAKMLNLYAHLTRKLYNDPAEIMKIKNKGIFLPKETLESLGISFTDSTISIPNDQYYMSSDYIKQWTEWKRLPELNDSTLPKEDKIIKWNYVYEWNQLAPFENNEDKWLGTFAPHYKRQDARKMYEDSQYKIIKHTYLNNISIENSESYNPLCPIIDESLLFEVNLDALLYFNSEETREIYDYNTENVKFWVHVNNIQDTISQEEKWDYHEQYETKKIISQNKLNAYKYKYLVPVEIQYPYYNLSKEELDALDYYESITLWYYPSEEFLSKLPEDIREQLEKEIELVEEIQKGEMQPEEACAEVGDKESLLGLCNLSKQTLTDLKVFPNPAQDVVNIEFYLLEPVQYKIILTDMTGNYIQDITDWRQGDEGIEQWFLTDRDNGTYLVQVITEKGEKLMAKFVVKR